MSSFACEKCADVLNGWDVREMELMREDGRAAAARRVAWASVDLSAVAMMCSVVGCMESLKVRSLCLLLHACLGSRDQRKDEAARFASRDSMLYKNC